MADESVGGRGDEEVGRAWRQGGRGGRGGVEAGRAWRQGGHGGREDVEAKLVAHSSASCEALR